MAFLLGETKDVRDLVKKEADAARAELERKASELGEEMTAETDRIKEIFKARSMHNSQLGRVSALSFLCQQMYRVKFGSNSSED